MKNILRLLKEEDIPDDNMALYEYFNDLDDETLSNYDFYVADDPPGLNWYRFMLSNFNGLNFTLKRYSVFKDLRKRYIANCIKQQDKNKLAEDLQITERTIRRYLDEMDVN